MKTFEDKMRPVQDKVREIRRRATDGHAALIYGTVAAVDKEAQTIDVTTEDDYSILGISLDVLPNGGSGILFYPALESTVVVGFIENQPQAPFIASFTQLEEVVIQVDRENEDRQLSLTADALNFKFDNTIGEVTEKGVSLSSDKITFNEGENGLVLIDKLTDRINKLVDAFNNHTHTLTSNSVSVEGSNSAGPVVSKNLSPISVPAITSKAQKFNQDEYESDKIFQE